MGGTRADRLKAALRENLKRRKTQTGSAEPPPRDAESGGTAESGPTERPREA